MSENPPPRHATDRSSIKLDDPQAVQYWTQKWAVTEAQLRRAVAKAGTKTDAVALEIGRPLL